MSGAAAVAAARARLALLWPGWRDMSGDPNPVPAAGLPAFGVRFALSGTERVGMSAAGLLSSGVLTVAIWAKPATADAEAEGQGLAAAASAALIAAPADLSGAVWDIVPDATEVEHDKTEARVIRAEQIFTIQTLT